ncbi:MAG: hypothetical protein AAGD32_11620 [Planctomycetota bacterium]
MSTPADKSGFGSTPMPPIDFLPGWYPKYIRWKGIVRVHYWLFATMVVALTAVGLGAWSEVADAQLVLTSHQRQLDESRSALQKMRHYHGIERQLRDEEQIFEHVGLNVESARVLATLDQALTPAMALTDVRMEAHETAMSAQEYLRLVGNAKPGAARPKVRKLRVDVAGMAPTDYDVSLFAGSIGSNPALELTKTESTEIEQDGRIMRQFRVSFTINLDYAPLPGA